MPNLLFICEKSSDALGSNSLSYISAWIVDLFDFKSSAVRVLLLRTNATFGGAGPSVVAAVEFGTH